MTALPLLMPPTYGIVMGLSASGNILRNVFSADSSVKTSPTDGGSLLVFSISDQLPLWLPNAIQKLDTLANLPPGWDGYDGLPLRAETSKFTIEVLYQISEINTPEPAIVPMSNGGVQLEWYVSGFEIEVQIVRPMEAYAQREDCSNGAEDEISIRADFRKLRGWLADLRKGLGSV